MSFKIRSGPLKGLRRNHYGAIYADPPWSFITRSDKGKAKSPEQHYDCMTLDDIKALPVAEIAAKDCALFMWVIDTHMAMALDVIKAWGFEDKTRAFCWVKLNKKYDTYAPEEQLAHLDKPYFKGMGYWSRANMEDVRFATRGAPKRLSKSVRRLIVSPVREHSRKPDETHDRIEQLVGGPYCELFGRAQWPGWDVMGNQTDKFVNAPHTPAIDWGSIVGYTPDETAAQEEVLLAHEEQLAINALI
jgi:N6-adenosine-specific RNA methylase IME4